MGVSSDMFIDTFSGRLVFFFAVIRCRSTFVSLKVYVDDLNVFHVPFLHQISTPNQHGTLETCIFVQFSSDPFNNLLAARTCHSTSIAVCLCRCQCFI